MNDRPRWKFERDLRRAIGPREYARTLERESAVKVSPTPSVPRKPGPNLRDTQHDRIVAELLKRPAVYADGFMRHICEALRVDGMTGEYWHELTGKWRLIPDAFKVDPQAKRITAWEVEDSNPVDDRKIDKYIDLFWIVDDLYWSLDLVRVDRLGLEGRPVSIFELQMMRDAAADRDRAPTSAQVKAHADYMRVHL